MLRLAQKIGKRFLWGFFFSLGIIQLEATPNILQPTDFWGYQKLEKQIGPEKVQKVINMVEGSNYPNIIRSIITVESSWNVKAKSPKEARGLMQIRLIAAKEIDPKISNDDLFDPFTNLEIGIEVFNRHMNYFANYSGKRHWALTAYNRGRTGAFKLNQHPPKTVYSQKVMSLVEEFTG